MKPQDAEQLDRNSSINNYRTGIAEYPVLGAKAKQFTHCNGCAFEFPTTGGRVNMNAFREHKASCLGRFLLKPQTTHE